MRSTLVLMWCVPAQALAVPLFVPVQTTVPADNAPLKSAVAACPAGRVAVSGGTEIYGRTGGIALSASGPEGVPTSPDAWFGVAGAVGAVAGPWGLTVKTLCATSAVASQIQIVTTLANPAPGATFVDALARCPVGTKVISGGARIFGPIDGTSLTASGPEGDDSWYGVALIDPAAPAGVRVDAFCLSEQIWAARFTQVTELTPSLGGFSADVATCPAGSYAFGGGARIAGPIAGLGLQSTISDPPAGAPLEWTASASDLGGGSPGWSLRTDAFCLRL